MGGMAQQGMGQHAEVGSRTRAGRVPAVDAGLVTGVYVYNAVIQGAGGPWYEFLIPVGLCGPWLLRRRWPLPAMGVVLIAALCQSLLGMPVLVADVMLAAGVYNLASRYRWQVSVPPALLTICWILLSWGPRLDELFLNLGDLGVFVLLVVTAWTVGALVRTRRLQVESLKHRARQLEREKQTQQRASVAAERARIARELHDIVSHSLSSVVLLADGAAHTVDEDPDRARHAMELVRDSARGALGQTRQILDLLRDDESEDSRRRSPHPGVGDLEVLVADFDRAGPAARLRVEGEVVELSGGLDLAVHRIVQEALTNARKHGGARLGQVDVEVLFPPTSGERDSLQVRITDDGAGGGASDADTDGHGLVGIRERVAALGGTLTAAPRPDGGFEVLARLPMTGWHGDDREGGR